ncbi:MAG: ATP-binding protein [Vicinamibacterales bacterium]
MKLGSLSLSGQVLTGTTILFVLITLTTSVVSAWQLDAALTREFETKGTAIANSIAGSSIELLLARDASSLQDMVDSFLGIEGVGYVMVVDGDQDIVSHTFVPAVPAALVERDRQVAAGGAAENTIAALELAGVGSYLDVTAPILAGVAGRVHVGMDRRVIQRTVRADVLLQGLFMAGIFVVSLGLAWVHINRVARPLVALTAHAKLVASEEHLRAMAGGAEEAGGAAPATAELARWAAAEIGELAAAFRDMDLELRRYIGNLRAAHQELADHNRSLEDKVQARTSELSAKNGELEATLGKLKQAQEQIVTQEKLASLGALTAGIAHEIKNPLNFITNFAELSTELADELKDSVATHVPAAAAADITDVVDMLRLNVQKITEHGRRADSIVRNMLLHSRSGKGERGEVDINAVLAENVSLAYHGLRGQDTAFNAKIETAFDPSAGRIPGVPQDLGRALLNILTNACYALREKSARLGDAYAPVLSVATRRLGDRVEIRIRDNGDGVPDAVKAKIFEPFFTTKPAGSGTGLGLSMTFDILVQTHRGTIDVDTAPGEFAEFIITLPTAGEGPHA